MLGIFVMLWAGALGEETCASGRSLLQRGLAKGEYNETLQPSSQSLLALNHTNESQMQLALVQRSEGRGRGARQSSEELDAVVSSKFFDDIADGFESIGQGIADVGMTVGSAVGNAAVVVGNSVVETAEIAADALPSEIKDAANSLGNAVVTAAEAVGDVGEMVVDAYVDLADAALSAAEDVAEQAAKVGSALGNKIADAANAIGEGIEKVGAMAVGFAKAAWEAIKDWINCLVNFLDNFMCRVLIGDQCDCDAGSGLDISGGGLSLTCYVKGGGLSSGYGFTSEGNFEMGDESSSGRTKLPGKEFVQSFRPQGQELKARHVALKQKQKRAPSGSCESLLDVALEGVVQFAPMIQLSAQINGDTELKVEGTVRASMDGLISAEGSCGFVAEKRFPKIPKTKVICGPAFCVAVMLQMVAEIELQGILTGSAEVAASADFNVKGSVMLNPKGHAEADFESPNIQHQHGFGFGASASGSVRLALGPELVIFPMPGVPITINPMMNAEIRAQGTLDMPVGSFIQAGQEAGHARKVHANTSTGQGRVNQIALCGAAALNLYSDISVMGFGLPKAISVSLSTGWIEEAITEALLEGADMLVDMATGYFSCLPLVGDAVGAAGDAVKSGARAAAGALGSLIPDLNLDFSTPSVELLKPTKLFCSTVAKSHGFDGSECSQELGCKSAGRPTAPMVTVAAPEQVRQTQRPSAAAPTCSTILMGDRFIELGDWRLADIDGRHFSVSHRSHYTAAIYREDGLTIGGWRSRDWNGWFRPTGAAKGIKFGFQFIQIGKWRIGAVNADHLSIAHVGGQVSCIWNQDNSLRKGPGTDHSTFDRPSGEAVGVSFGDRFVQVGEFRLGDLGHNGEHSHFGWTGSKGQTIQLFRSDGIEVHPGGSQWSFHLNDRHPSAWTCKSVQEMAHGNCDGVSGAWGDRFIEIGNWRIGVVDIIHLEVSNRYGANRLIYSAWTNTLYDEKKSGTIWNRPLGFPHGIAFGHNFIQIGLYRIGSYDSDHLSFSWSNGKTIMLYKSDGSALTGPRTDLNLWERSLGPATGVTFGEKYLQLGSWRIGDVGCTGPWATSCYFQFTHVSDQTPQMLRSDGGFHGGATNWGKVLNDRYPKWHCGNIQQTMGICSGMMAGPDYLTIGEWQVAAIDNHHFSISHKDGKTAMIYTKDGKQHPGPRTDYRDRWSYDPTSQSPIQFGDRFMQIGSFRMGEVNSQHFSIAHKDGWTNSIFRGDGTEHPGPRTDWNVLARQIGEPLGIGFGDRFIQFGNFRMGDVDGTHFSISHSSGHTIAIFKKDGTVEYGPREDFTLFGRSLSECHVVPL